VLPVAEVSARFAFAEGAGVTFSDSLEVSLDCCICHRCRRTVLFQLGSVEGKCTPTGHPFPGKLVGRGVGSGSRWSVPGAASRLGAVPRPTSCGRATPTAGAASGCTRSWTRCQCCRWPSKGTPNQTLQQTAGACSYNQSSRAPTPLLSWVVTAAWRW
jgi:hypothetical protein